MFLIISINKSHFSKLQDFGILELNDYGLTELQNHKTIEL